MTDQEQGPGWWLASDGKWYPPQGFPQMPVYQAVTPAAERPPATWPVLGGAGLLVLGSFLPWVSIGRISAYGIEGDGIFTLVGGLILAVFGIVVLADRGSSRAMGIASGIVAVLAGLLCIYEIVHISSQDVTLLGLSASPGSGSLSLALGQSQR